MKSKLIKSLNYTGIVTLSKYNGSKKTKLLQVYNSGGTQLFEFLKACFLGETEKADARRPAKIRLLKIQGTTIEEASSGFIGLFTPPVETGSDSDCTVTYSFLIPRDQLVGLTSLNNLGLGLYSKNTTSDDSLYNCVAICDLSGHLTASDLYSSSSLVVDWSLCITEPHKANQ